MKKLWIIGGGVVVFVILIIGVSTLRRAPENVIYNGKSLRNWALQSVLGDETSKREATVEFRKLGSNAVPGLTVLLRTKDSFLRRKVWEIEPKMPGPIQKVIVARVRRPDAATIRSAAARSLEIIGGDARESVPVLATMLRKDIPQCRFEAALALGSIGGDGVTELVAAVESTDSNVRYAAISGLGNVRTCENAVVLALLLAAGDPANSVPAGGALSRFSTNALPFLKNALENPSPETRRQAIRALGSLGASRDEIVPPLLKMVKDSDPGCRVQATQVLGMSAVPNPTMIAGLVGALDDPDIQVRVAAIRGLQQGHLTTACAVTDLARCLDDKSPLVRESAAQALGAIGKRANVALPKLIQAADDKEQAVRAAATGAIARIEEQQKAEQRREAD